MIASDQQAALDEDLGVGVGVGVGVGLGCGVGLGRDILVVDDSEANRIAIDAVLAPLRRELVLASSGIEALVQLLKRDFALILLDVAMPGMNGFETARMIRLRDRTRAVPIIFMTGFSSPHEDVLRGYELGAFDFLIKPIQPDVLRAKAQVFLSLQERTIALHEALRRESERALETQRRHFEALAMQQRFDQLAETDRRKDEFLAILSHELRNPLQPLQMAVEILHEQVGKPVPLKIHEIVERQVRHLSRLVDDLLDVTRFEAGKLQLRRETVRMSDIVDHSIAACRAAAEARSQQIVRNVRDEDRALVIGDSVRLVQVLTNLIGNATKYTPPGGRIEIASSVVNDEVCVRVSDNGRGIRAEVLPKIFDMFVQERTTTNGAGGLGLGLGLVKRITALHRGSVTATSDGPGKGSSFELRLARAPIEPVPERAAWPEPPSRGHPMRMVICDDAADIRDLLADVLRSQGHTVLTAENGAAAVKLIVSEKPDVALIDIGLPDMDGYTVARTVRGELGDRTPRLIAVTGYGQPADLARAHEAGFDGHILKPATAEKIMRTVQAGGANARPL